MQRGFQLQEWAGRNLGQMAGTAHVELPGLGKAMEHLRLPEKPNVVENHSLMGGGRDMELENGEGPIHVRSSKLGWGSGTHMKREK